MQQITCCSKISCGIQKESGLWKFLEVFWQLDPFNFRGLDISERAFVQSWNLFLTVHGRVLKVASQVDCILCLPTEVVFIVTYGLLKCVFFVTWCYIRHYLLLVGTFVSLKSWGESQQGWQYTEGSPLLIEQGIPGHGLAWTLSEGCKVLEVYHIFQEWTTFYLRWSICTISLWRAETIPECAEPMAPARSPEDSCHLVFQ